MPFCVTVQLYSNQGGGEEDTFQSFLVSVQNGNSLIGTMAVSGNDSEVTCRNTSVQNADSNDKTDITFTWTAPEDLDTTISVILRYKVK